MIVTLTINPAIDRIFSVDRLAFEDRAYINSSRESAGGRGITAASVLSSFGASTMAVLTCGGEAGRRLKGHLAGCGYRVLAVPITNETRTNITVTDKHGLTVNLNEAGPPMKDAEVERVVRAVRQALAGSSWLMVCGSLPPGVPPSIYAKLIAMARKRGVRTLLHADGEPLREGIEAHPTVVTPNEQEAGRLLGRTLLTRAHSLEAVRRIREMGADSVVLSLGSRGAVGSFSNGLFEALPPRVDAVCPIGAGDALTAAYVWAMRREPEDPAGALRWGVAAGTASACLPGMGFASIAQTEEIYRKVEVRRAE